MDIWSFFFPRHNLAKALAKVGAKYNPSPSQFLFSPNAYLSTPVADAVSNPVSFHTKSLQYLLRNLPSFAPRAVSSIVNAATDTGLFLLLTSTGLVDPRLFPAATVVPNHRASFISCWTTLHLTLKAF